MRAAAGPFVALGVLTAAVGGAVKFLEPSLARIGVPPAYAMGVAVGPVVLLTVVLLFWAHRATQKQSRLLRTERFDLRVRSPADLLGRDVDIEDLKALIDQYDLVYLDGESGSGKSALAQHGLAPRLLASGDLLPIVISEYGGDWDRALSHRVLLSLLGRLTAEQREAIGRERRPAVGAVEAKDVAELLGQISQGLGLLPVLIFDQFDDYQLAFRAEFLDEHRAWISADVLKAKNAFWAAVDQARMRGHVRVLVVTRSDTSLGLHSVRFSEVSSSRTLTRLRPEWLPRVFEQLTREDETGAVVIEHPDAGWTDLERMLSVDLQRNGAVLPQQVRVTILGLRKLPRLTPRHYRRAGGATGAEALYVRDAIQSAADASGELARNVRDLLLKLVERGPDSTAKTIWRTEDELASAIPDPLARGKALRQLQIEEIVRARPGLLSAEADWQLDHDYLARSVLAEERSANRLISALREGSEAWSNAGSDLRQRLRLLLPLRAQLELVIEKIRSKGQFTYRPYQGYAAWSALRLLPIVGVLGLGVVSARELILQNEAREIVDALSADSFNESKDEPILALWAARPAVRDRVAKIIIEGPRLGSAGEEWVSAYVSLEPDAATRLSAQLSRPFMAEANLSPERLSALAEALRVAAVHLPADEAQRLIDQLMPENGPKLSMLEARNRLMAVVMLAPALEPAAVGPLVESAESWRSVKDEPQLRLMPMMMVYQLSEEVDQTYAAKFVTKALAPSARDDDEMAAARIGLSEALAPRLSPRDADRLVQDLQARLGGPSPAAAKQRFGSLLPVLAGRLEGEPAHRLAQTALEFAGDPRQPKETRVMWCHALAATADHVTDAQVTEIVARRAELSPICVSQGVPRDPLRGPQSLWSNLASRLDSASAAQVLAQPGIATDRIAIDRLVSRLTHPDTTRLALAAKGPILVDALQSRARTLENQARRSQDAYDQLRPVLERLTDISQQGGEQSPFNESVAFALVDRLSPEDARSLADLVGAGLEPEDMGTTGGQLQAQLFGRLSARAGGEAAVSAVEFFMDAIDEDPSQLDYSGVRNGLESAGMALAPKRLETLTRQLIDLASDPTKLAADDDLTSGSNDRDAAVLRLTQEFIPRLPLKSRKGIGDLLRQRLNTPAIGADRFELLHGALFEIAVANAKETEETSRVEALDILTGLACPLADDHRDAAWAALDQVSGKAFKKDFTALLAWASREHGITPGEVRPNLRRSAFSIPGSSPTASNS